MEPTAVMSMPSLAATPYAHVTFVSVCSANPALPNQVATHSSSLALPSSRADDQHGLLYYIHMHHTTPCNNATRI